MPVVLRVKGYRFGFYASDQDEPMHVHVKKGARIAKYWLEPAVKLADNSDFRSHELNKIRRLVSRHREYLIEAWHEFFRD